MREIGKRVLIALIALLIAAAIMGCRKQESGENGIKASGDLTEKTVSVPEGTYKVFADALSMSGDMELEITSGGTGKCMVRADDNVIDAISVEVEEDEKLILIKSNKQRFQGVHCRITVDVPVDKLEIAGAYAVDFETGQAKEVELVSRGASRIQMRGSCEKAVYRLHDSTRLEALEMKCSVAEIEALDAAAANIYAAEKVEASAGDAAEIVYDGNPQVVEKKTSGAATIQKK